MSLDIPTNQRFDQRKAATLVSAIEAELIGAHFYPETEIHEAEELGGGFSNANFLLRSSPHDIYPKLTVLRVSPYGPDAVHREAALMKVASEAGVNVPEVYGIVDDKGGRAAMHMQYIAGTTLEVALHKQDALNILEQCGAQLALVHKVSYEQAGLFDTHGQIEMVFADFEEECRQQIVLALEGLAGERLQGLAPEVRKLIDDQWHMVSSAKGPIRLLHCDFNPKNILVAESGEVYVIDWEFALAGNPLVDLGNFLRFYSDYGEAGCEAFAKGYQNAGGELCEGWRSVSRLLDLTSMAQFLNREEELPQTFQTAAAVIQDTLAYFSNR